MGNKKPLESSKGVQTYRNTPVSSIRTITVGWDSHPSCREARRLSGLAPYTAGGDFHSALKQNYLIYTDIIGFSLQLVNPPWIFYL